MGVLSRVVHATESQSRATQPDTVQHAKEVKSVRVYLQTLVPAESALDCLVVGTEVQVVVVLIRLEETVNAVR